MGEAAPDILVVDSSVAVKWFLPDREDHVDRALDLLQAHLDERVCLAAPAHLRLEVLSALMNRGLEAGLWSARPPRSRGFAWGGTRSTR